MGQSYMSPDELPFEEPERWLPIPGWEDLYWVSDLGRVRSWHKRTLRKRPDGLLTPTLMGDPPHLRLTVVLYRSGVRANRPVHQLVAEAFLGPRPTGCDVRHGPGGPFDNRAVNLSYGTRRDNMLDMVRDGTLPMGETCRFAILTDEQVRVIRARYTAGGVTQLALAREYGVGQVTVSEIVRRTTWRHI